MDFFGGLKRKRVLIGASRVKSLAHEIPDITTARRLSHANARAVRRSALMISAPLATLVSLILLQVMASVSAANEIPLLRQDGRALAESYTGQCFATETTYCHDNPDYYSWKGLPCSFHAELISTSAGENCFHEWLLGGGSWFSISYDQEQIFELAWECPCACNIRCHEEDEQNYEDDSIKIPSSFDWGIADDTDTAPPTSAPTYDTKGFIPGGFGDFGVPSEALNRAEDEVDTMSIIAPVVSAEGDVSSSSSSIGTNILSLPNAFALVAVIAAGCVIVVVVYISVFSLLRAERKARGKDSQISVTSIIGRGGSGTGNTAGKSSSRLSKAKSKQNEGKEDAFADLEIQPSVSSMSDSCTSQKQNGESSLDTSEKFRGYRAWKESQKKRGGIEDGDDVIEP